MYGANILMILCIGAVAGWLSGLIMKGDGFGVFGNIIVGLLGAIVGGALFGMLESGTSAGVIGSIITAVLGAIALLFLIRLVARTQ